MCEFLFALSALDKSKRIPVTLGYFPHCLKEGSLRAAPASSFEGPYQLIVTVLEAEDILSLTFPEPPLVFIGQG